MSAADAVASMVAQALKSGSKLEKLEAPSAFYKELGGKPGEQLVVHGVPIFLMSDRDEQICAVQQYAYLRWHVTMSMDDARSLMKAVPDEELSSLAPLIVDQHLDDHGYEDPVDTMDASEVADLKDRIAELGIEVEL